MLLHKPQVYRHLLFNKLATTGSTGRWGRLGRLGSGPLQWSVIKLSLLLVLFEVYIKWAKMDLAQAQNELQTPTEFIQRYSYLTGISCLGLKSQRPLVTILEFAVFQALVRLILNMFLGWENVSPKCHNLRIRLFF